MNADASNVIVGNYRLPISRGLLGLYLPVLALLFLVAIAARYGHIPVSRLTRDMATTANVHPLTGLASNVGILLWCATAAICLFSSSLLRQRGDLPAARFLWWAGLMSAGLLVDDFFLFHEYLAPLHFHINEKVVLVSYVCVTVIYLLRHARLILGSSYRLLAAAVVMFGVSIMLDMANFNGYAILAEDGCKLLGIASWFGYHAGRARDWMARAPDLRAQATNLGGVDVTPTRTVSN